MKGNNSLKSRIGQLQQKIDTYRSTTTQVSTIPTSQTPPSPATASIIVIIKPTDDEISPSLHNRIDFVNTDTLSDENLMMAGLGRNMYFYIHPLLNIIRNTCCVTDRIPLPMKLSLLCYAVSQTICITKYSENDLLYFHFVITYGLLFWATPQTV